MVAMLLGAAAVQAQTVEISGSTSVVKETVEANAAAIKAATGVEVKGYAMVTGRGVLALFQGKTAVAATSASLEESTANAKKTMADAGINVPVPANLMYHEVGREKIGVYVHKDNPVTALTNAQLKDLFSGKVRNWKQVGGPDLPVKLSLSAPGSSTRGLVQAHVLNGAEYASDAAEFRTGLAAMNEVTKDRGGLAAGGLMLLEHANSGSLKVVQTAPIERPVAFLTIGKPSEPMQKVIDFLRKKK
jgi:phosphate transport system substrate-binding protein